MKLNFCCLFCHSTMGLTRCYRTAVFYIHICSFSTSVHSWDTTTSRFENKRRPCWNSTSGFDFQLFIVIGVWFCTDLPNFIRKSQRRYISPTCGEALTEPIWTEIWTFVVVPRVIMCSKFWTEIFRGYDFTGVELSVFLLIIAWALQQCSATALAVIKLHSAVNGVSGVVFLD